MRNVWYHQIWIQTYLGFIVFILVQVGTDYGHPERAFFWKSQILGLGRQIGLSNTWDLHVAHLSYNGEPLFGTISPSGTKHNLLSIVIMKSGSWLRSKRVRRFGIRENMSWVNLEFTSGFIQQLWGLILTPNPPRVDKGGHFTSP